VLELGSLGSVRGALSNERPYREPRPKAEARRYRFNVAYRRLADTAGQGGRRRSWADSAPTGPASGRTGFPSKAVIALGARNRVHRPKR
jgi:hypothetical protein